MNQDFILDYGCGRTARNSEWLAGKGNKMFRYDPYWGKEGGDFGWLPNRISNELPKFPHFDIVFSCFVLNVVTKKVQDNIIDTIRSRPNEIYTTQIHIVRNDVVAAAKNAMGKKDPVTTEFHKNYFKKGSIENFARFGFPTSRGFQRQIDEIKGFELIKETGSYKVFIKHA